jgi:polysaccharide pyruvyl transferase CsaB
LAQNKQNIVICGNYGASNLGDEAILDGILALVKKATPANITVMSHNPEETAQAHQTNFADENQLKTVHLLPAGFRSFWRALTKKGLLETLRAIKNCDIFILGGGGLFTDERPLAILIWSIQAAAARFFNKPIFCLGQSVGPLMTFFGRHMTKVVFKKAKVITVRDASSAIVLQKLGIHNAHVLTDPAFFLDVEFEGPDASGLTQTTSMSLSAKRENYVVLSVRPWSSHDESKLKKLAKFIDWLYQKKGLRTVLVPFQFVLDNDVKPLEEIYNSVLNKNAVEIFEFTSDYREVLKLMAKAKAVVGMRLHSLIFATLTETPFLALAYSQKVVSFVHSLQKEEYLLKWSHFEAEDLQDNFEKLLDNYELIQKNLAYKKPIFKNLAEQNSRYLSEILKNL